MGRSQLLRAHSILLIGKQTGRRKPCLKAGISEATTLFPLPQAVRLVYNSITTFCGMK